MSRNGHKARPTPAELRILRAFEKLYWTMPHGPSLAEVGKIARVHVSHVSRVMRRLQAKGRVTRPPGKYRSYELVGVRP